MPSLILIFHWGSLVLWPCLLLYYFLCPTVSLLLLSFLGRLVTSLQKGWFPKNYRRGSSHGDQKLYHVASIPFYLSGEVKVSPDSREEERNSPAIKEKHAHTEIKRIAGSHLCRKATTVHLQVFMFTQMLLYFATFD